MAKSIKFGIAAPVPGVSTGELIQFVVKAEKAGFDSIWFPDHMVFMAKKMTPEVWSVITAASTASSRIQMGAVGDPHRIHPAVMAQRLATVEHISGSRIFTCIGYGEKMNLDPYGIKWNKPLTRLVESVKIMRSLWSGQAVSFDGEFYNLSEAELRIEPLNKTVPVYIAATGPRALGIAGEYGDGWLTNAMPSSVFRKKSDAVDEGAKKRDPSLGSIDKTLFIFTSIAGDENEAYSTLEPIKHAIIWPELLQEAGYDIEIEERYKGLEYTKIMPNDSEMLNKFREMGEKYYSRDMVMDFVIAGSRNQVVKRIEEYIDAGVDHFFLRDFSPDRGFSLDVISREIMPMFKG